MSNRAEGARSRRVDVLVVLALVLPSVVFVALTVVRGDDPAPFAEPPVRERVTQLSIACPTPVERPAGDVELTRVPGVAGGPVELRVNDGGKTRPAGEVEVAESLTVAPGSGTATVVAGRDAAAPGLVVGRDESGAVPECREPWYDEWFVGLGAAARESSVIELINPDPSAAVVNIDVHGSEGPLEDASWHGVTVPGHSVEWVRLSKRPVREAVAAHVTVSRGRISAVARHTWDALGSSVPTTDYIPAQSHPATENLLLGVPEEGTWRRLHLANPGDDEVRVKVHVVTADATFVPTGSRDVTVPPRAQVAVGLNRYLDAEAASGTLGLLVESTAPVVAGVRTVVDGDLRAIGPVTAYDDPMVALLPDGAKRLVLGGATKVGTVRITATTATGKAIWDEKRFEISAGHALSVDLPRRADRVVVTARNTPVAATLVATDDAGTGVMRLLPARVFAEVPAVRPGESDTP